jgi:hypothetical protein
MTDLTWVHLAVTANGTNLITYRNGVVVNTVAAAFNLSYNSNLGVGYYPSFGQYFNGDIDEVSIASPRSAAWIGYEYTITNDAASFWSNSGWTAVSAGASVGLIGAGLCGNSPLISGGLAA